jgi:hypothetical protein
VPIVITENHRIYSGFLRSGFGVFYQVTGKNAIALALGGDHDTMMGGIRVMPQRSTRPSAALSQTTIEETAISNGRKSENELGRDRD